MTASTSNEISASSTGNRNGQRDNSGPQYPWMSYSSPTPTMPWMEETPSMFPSGLLVDQPWLSQPQSTHIATSTEVITAKSSPSSTPKLIPSFYWTTGDLVWTRSNGEKVTLSDEVFKTYTLTRRFDTALPTVATEQTVFNKRGASVTTSATTVTTSAITGVSMDQYMAAVEGRYQAIQGQTLAWGVFSGLAIIVLLSIAFVLYRRRSAKKQQRRNLVEEGEGSVYSRTPTELQPLPKVHHDA